MKSSSKSKPASKAQRQVREDSWQKELEAISINDDNWWCMITMIVESSPEHSQYVSMLNEAAESDRRKSIYLLSARQLLGSVKTLSKLEQDKCPTVQGICHYANKFLSQGEGSLPTWLLARMIKFLVYRAKVEHVTRARREMILKRDIEMENQHMQMVGSPGAKSATKQQKVTPAEDSYANGKANTRLRKRDEEWREKVYVDDAPEDGPDLYVVLVGFYDPELLLELIRLDLPLTAVLKVKGPDDVIELGTEDEAATKKAKKPTGIGASKLTLVRFWDEFEKRINNRDTTLDYCRLMRRIFCPPAISKLNTESQCDSAMADLYDRMSYIVYDLYDVYRQHISYVRSMKLQSGIVEVGKRKRENMKTYYEILNSMPVEAAIVPIILDAMLAQVEEDLGSSTSDLSENLRISEKQSDVTCVGQVGENRGKRLEENRNFRLILHGDDFTLNNYSADARNGIFRPAEERLSLFGEISETLENILRNIGVARIWRDFPELGQDTLRMYEYHVEKLGQCFEPQPMNVESVYHYINLMIFDKMIFKFDNVENNVRNYFQKINSFSDITLQDLKSKSMSDCKISYSRYEHLFSKNNTSIRSFSDSRIDYGKSIEETYECIPLISLINPLEILNCAFSEKMKFENTEDPPLSEFDSMELLSTSIFLQTVCACLRHFDEYQYRYSQLTDSVLLHFYHTYEPDGVSEKRKSASIATPVCLRDFCDYIVNEEVDWLRAEENKYKNEIKRAKDTKLKLTNVEDTKTHAEDFRGFCDEDFILSSSLKAKTMNKTRISVPIEGTELKDKTKVASTSKESKEIKVRSLGKTGESKEKKLEKKVVESETSFLPRRKILEARCAQGEEPYDFIGYDLGSSRVQISSIEKFFFSKDGTSVRIYREEWLYQKAQLHITITYPECSLKLCHVANGSSSHMYHLMTRDGGILAFSTYEDSHQTNSSQARTNKIITEFCASFSSGLVIEPVLLGNAETSLYVQQRYVSKEQNSLDTDEHEKYRKFLRNGTVLKFLMNGAVIVLRPNGTIVNCHSFARIEKQKSVDRAGSKNKRDSSLSLINKSKKKKSNTGESRRRRITEEDQLSKMTASADDQISSRTDTSDCGDFRISDYTVFDHDGSHYQVSNDQIVRQFDGLIVSNQSDYEVDEIFIRRADGTSTLLNSKGELITSFADGTRIVTGYVIESESIICDWTIEEFEMYFAQGESAENIFDHISDSNSNPDVNTDLDMTTILSKDSFVLIALTCRFEHKNYATVMYDQSTLGCALLMPNDVEVMISADGRYDVKVNSEVALKIDKTKLEFSKKICQACQGTSVSVYNFERSSLTDDDLMGSLLRTKDMFGNIFFVNWDGTTDYRKSTIKTDHLCVPSDDSSLRSRYRIFAMKRDLSGYEYHHKSELIAQDNKVTTDKDTSIFHCPVPARSELFYSISLTPWNQQFFSKKYPQPYYDYELRPSNFERRHFVRSTYSIPYDWLFPFGKNGNGISANTWNLTFKENMENNVLPDFFVIRLLQQIKQRDDNVIINLQKAHHRYSYTMINQFGEYRSYVRKNEKTKAETELEIDLKTIFLGYKNIINQKYFQEGVFSKLTSNVEKKIQKIISERKVRKKQRKSKEEIEWYLKCRRENTKIPYFDLANGACFLWANNCLEKALDSEKL